MAKELTLLYCDYVWKGRHDRLQASVLGMFISFVLVRKDGYVGRQAAPKGGAEQPRKKIKVNAG